LKILSEKLRILTDDYYDQLTALSENRFSESRGEGKWTRKEELGHLIDSAHNNLRRFIVTQYEDKPHIIYKQDDWVKLSAYPQWTKNDVIQSWKMINLQICAVWNNISDESKGRLCNTGRDSEELHSIEWLSVDYIKHLQHHMHHVLDLEHVAYP
jgi:hypothetical protein